MPNCSVFSCKKRSETSSKQKDNVTFHLFPKDAMTRDVWIRACANHDSWTPKRTSTICSQHFEASCFILLSNNKRRLKQCALPTLKLAKVDPEREESEPETSSSKIRKVEIHEDPQPTQTGECKTTEDQPCTSPSRINICKSPTLTYNPPIQDTPRKRKLKQRLQMKNKQIKRLQTQKRYLKKKVAGLQELLNDLTEKSLINKEDRLVLNKIGVEEKELLTRQLLKSKTGKIPRNKYSPELRCFALTLNFYSPKAYRYVRKTFGTCLPAPRTLTKWYSSIEGKPGFTKEALVALTLFGTNIYKHR